VAEDTPASARWLRFAQEDLEAGAALLGSGGVARHACHFAQQAAEKALKAALIHVGIEPPRTHDLDLLAQLMPASLGELVRRLPDLAELSVWAVAGRYPGDWEDAESEDARRSISTAAEVVELVTGAIGRSNTAAQ
jgi:HEPN domain-containing protein